MDGVWAVVLLGSFLGDFDGSCSENHHSKPAGGSGKCGWLRRRREFAVCRQTVAILLFRSDSGKCWGTEENVICFERF